MKASYQQMERPNRCNQASGLVNFNWQPVQPTKLQQNVSQYDLYQYHSKQMTPMTAESNKQLLQESKSVQCQQQSGSQQVAAESMLGNLPLFNQEYCNQMTSKLTVLNLWRNQNLNNKLKVNQAPKVLKVDSQGRVQVPQSAQIQRIRSMNVQNQVQMGLNANKVVPSVPFEHVGFKPI